MSRGSMGKLWFSGWRPSLQKEALLPQHCSAWKLRFQAVHGSYSCSKLDVGLQRSCVVEKVTGTFQQSHSLVALGAPCPPLLDTEDSVGASGRCVPQDCTKQCMSPGLCKSTLTHFKQPAHPRTASNSWGSESPPNHLRFCLGNRAVKVSGVPVCPWALTLGSHWPWALQVYCNQGHNIVLHFHQLLQNKNS